MKSRFEYMGLRAMSDDLRKIGIKGVSEKVLKDYCESGKLPALTRTHNGEKQYSICYNAVAPIVLGIEYDELKRIVEEEEKNRC